jgi:hypothetical protein
LHLERVDHASAGCAEQASFARLWHIGNGRKPSRRERHASSSKRIASCPWPRQHRDWGVSIAREAKAT